MWKLPYCNHFYVKYLKVLCGVDAEQFTFLSIKGQLYGHLQHYVLWIISHSECRALHIAKDLTSGIWLNVGYKSRAQQNVYEWMFPSVLNNASLQITASYLVFFKFFIFRIICWQLMATNWTTVNLKKEKNNIKANLTMVNL